MTGFNNNNNNKFIPNIPKTFQVLELRDQQQQPVKKSLLSPAARSKVINRSGSNYFSEKEGYGPCFKSDCNFSITATLVDRNGNSRSETRWPTSYGEVSYMAKDISFGLGEWETNSGSSFLGGTNHFAPSTMARVTLSTEVDRVAFGNHGSQKITVVENPNYRDVSVTVNGFRK